MVTKTLTIMEDVYEMMLSNKLKNESFSDELRRIFSKKKKQNLSEFYGVLSEEEGEGLMESLKNIKAMNLKLQKKRIK